MGLALAGGLLPGCTSAGLEGGLETSSTYSFAGEADVSLPDTMSVLPSSFAGQQGSDGRFEAAALSPAEMAEEPVRPEAFAAPEEPVAPRNVAAPGADHSEVDRLIAKYADFYDVPAGLVRRVVKRESNFYPGAYNRGHWGLMQIKHATARGMGYDGPARGLLDAETNLKYAVKYLRGAWLVARGNQDRAVRFYASGYYYDAKRMGLLEETGLGRDRRRRGRA